MDDQFFAPPTIERQDLEWAQSILRHRIGEDAEEYAGIGLMKAIETFDPGRNVPWRSWAAQQIVWTARDEMRKLNGRPGSAQYESHLSTHSFDETYEQPATTIDDRRDQQGERWTRALDVLRDIDQLPEDQRLMRLGRIMAGMRVHAVRRLTRKRAGKDWSPLMTRNYRHLVDGLMLFGAQLEPCYRGSDQVRVSIARTWTQRRSLFFALVFCERNGIRMRLRSGEETIGEKIIYSSSGNTNLREDYERWYDGGQANTPEIELDELKLMVWAVGSLAWSASKRMVTVRRLKLTAPRLTRSSALNLASQIRAIKPDWKVDVLAGSSRFSVIYIENADEVRDWLSRQIPETTWTRTESLHLN